MNKYVDLVAALASSLLAVAVLILAGVLDAHDIALSAADVARGLAAWCADLLGRLA